MIFVTGDTHENQHKWVEQIEPVLSPVDIILVCVEIFGIGFWNDRYDIDPKRHFMISLRTEIYRAVHR